jgi:hypothetical protein
MVGAEYQGPHLPSIRWGATRSRSLGRPRGFAGNPPSMGTFASIATKLRTLSPSQESTYRQARQRAMGLPVGQSEGKRGAAPHRCGSLLDLLAESKARFWMVMNSSVYESQSDPSLSGATLFTLTCYCYHRPHRAPCVRQHTRRRGMVYAISRGASDAGVVNWHGHDQLVSGQCRSRM